MKPADFDNRKQVVYEFVFLNTQLLGFASSEAKWVI